MKKTIAIVGSGTAGLVSALIIKSLFCNYTVKIVSSSVVGIIGVGEGTTEHWEKFLKICNISAEELIVETEATHKYGILFKNWSTNLPNYYHSISSHSETRGSFIGNYSYCLANDWLLTNTFSTVPLSENKIVKTDFPHRNVNQYHFDTFKLNDFLLKTAKRRGIEHIDDYVVSINRNLQNGFIESLGLKDEKALLYADFFIDASGFQRVLMGNLDKQEFIDYNEYLPCDSAFNFPTPLEDSGQIKPYTLATAMSSGWVWEIPTQKRRGNGYVYSSAFCSENEAIDEVSNLYGFQVEPVKSFKFNAGYYKNTWQYNCVSIGLSSGFVEPLEATSISVSIQQSLLLCSYLPTFKHGNVNSVKSYNSIVDGIMENILLMISLHYVSDRIDSDMWRNQKNSKKPEELQRLIGLWSERCPELHDILNTGYELFQIPHFWHVAQGQGILHKNLAFEQMSDYSSWRDMEKQVNNIRSEILTKETIDHAQSLRDLVGAHENI